MSIASEITRLQGAKSALKASIKAKGVDVADSDLISTYASKVDAISGGGEAAVWTRDSDAPDLDSINVALNNIYISYDTTLSPQNNFANFSVDGGAYVVEVGNISNGQFVAETTYNQNSGSTFNKTLPTANKYCVCHIYPANEGSNITMFNLKNNVAGGNSNTAERDTTFVQPIYEIYYNLNLNGSYSRWNRFVKHIKIWGSHTGSAAYLFFNNISLEYAEINADFSECTNMSYFFYSCYKLKSFKFNNKDFSSVSNIDSMFFYCKALKEIDLSEFNFSNVTSMRNIFATNGSHDFIKLPACKPTNISGLFGTNGGSQYTKYYDLSLMDLSNATEMNIMFYCCTFDKIIMPQAAKMPNGVLDMSNFLWGSRNTNIDLTGLVAQRGSTVDFFTNIYQLSYIGAPVIYANFKIYPTPAWTRDDLMLIVNALPQLEDGESFTFTMGSTPLGKLTADDKAVATSKGWTLA